MIPKRPTLLTIEKFTGGSTLDLLEKKGAGRRRNAATA